METHLMPKTAKEYVCESCDFRCSKNSNYVKHINTRKHHKNIKGDKVGDKGDRFYIYNCDICKKSYNSRNGLWKHKKKCKTVLSSEIPKTTPDQDENTILHELDMKSLIVELVKSNTELQKQILELCKNSNGGGVTIDKKDL